MGFNRSFVGSVEPRIIYFDITNYIMKDNPYIYILPHLPFYIICVILYSYDFKIRIEYVIINRSLTIFRYKDIVDNYIGRPVIQNKVRRI